MTRETTRRRVLIGMGTGTAVGLAGCAGGSGNDNSGGSNSSGGSNASGASGGNSSGSTRTSGSGGESTQTSGSSNQGASGPLTADGSSTVYPITSTAGSFWSSNPKASDEEYWGPSQYDIDTKKCLADYWAGLYGFESSGSATPPYKISVGLSHSDVGVTKVSKGQVDIGDASAPVEAELPDRSSYKKFTNHVVGIDAQPIVVSKSIKDAGVTKLTLDQLKKIYKGKIENWSKVGGPDKKIQVVGRVEGSGTDTSFRANVFGSGDAPIPGVDVRKGENQQVQTLVSNSDNAIAYLALAFTDPKKDPAVALEIEGTTYELGKNLAQKGYPLARDLHCYTWDGTSKKEAAFLRMILSDFGQKNFVETNDYLTLTDKRQKKQLNKLPSPSN